ncbi:hypothetical protein B0H19DRAFT_1247206 [Mycena capillaripes]|nr:hypothetical protein B0H19DRAFT_1247206 [Mycena capillaripes]
MDEILAANDEVFYATFPAARPTAQSKQVEVEHALLYAPPDIKAQVQVQVPQCVAVVPDAAPPLSYGVAGGEYAHPDVNSWAFYGYPRQIPPQLDLSRASMHARAHSSSSPRTPASAVSSFRSPASAGSPLAHSPLAHSHLSYSPASSPYDEPPPSAVSTYSDSSAAYSDGPSYRPSLVPEHIPQYPHPPLLSQAPPLAPYPPPFDAPLYPPHAYVDVHPQYPLPQVALIPHPHPPPPTRFPFRGREPRPPPVEKRREGYYPASPLPSMMLIKQEEADADADADAEGEEGEEDGEEDDDDDDDEAQTGEVRRRRMTRKHSNSSSSSHSHSHSPEASTSHSHSHSRSPSASHSPATSTRPEKKQKLTHKSSKKDANAKDGKKDGKDAPKKPPLACLFCRGRKIACGPPSGGSGAGGGACNQCSRRALKCEYPVESRRGMRKKKVQVQMELGEGLSIGAPVASGSGSGSGMGMGMSLGGVGVVSSAFLPPTRPLRVFLSVLTPAPALALCFLLFPASTFRSYPPRPGSWRSIDCLVLSLLYTSRSPPSPPPRHIVVILVIAVPSALLLIAHPTHRPSPTTSTTSTTLAGAVGLGLALDVPVPLSVPVMGPSDGIVGAPPPPPASTSIPSERTRDPRLASAVRDAGGGVPGAGRV